MLVLAACGGGGGGGDAGPDGNPSSWQLVGQHRPSSLLGVWAADDNNIWIVGGREAIGAGPTVLHFDGTAWTKLDTGLLNIDLWNVFGFGDTVFLGGSNGTILRYTASTGVFEPITTPTPDIVFGLWGSSPDDVWAVGGQNTGSPFVWRYQGTQFDPVAGVPTELTTGAVWKVTGRSATDVWMSASQGLVLHWNGSALSNQTIGGPEDALFSIGCSQARCVAAGTNVTNGVLYQDDGAGFTSRVPTTDGPVWRGVTPVGENMYVVGQFGAVIHFDGTNWVSDPPGVTSETFHATWATATSVLAVGGMFDRTPTIEGVLVYNGPRQLPALP